MLPGAFRRFFGGLNLKNGAVMKSATLKTYKAVLQMIFNADAAMRKARGMAGGPGNIDLKGPDFAAFRIAVDVVCKK